MDEIASLSQGLLKTALITVTCCATGFIVALIMVALRRLGSRPVAALLDTLSYVLRGVPVLALLFLVYFGLPGLGLRVPSLVAMMLSLGLIAAAYIAEVFRGALDGVENDELLAATAMGMSRFQVLIHVEFPQMLRFSVPGVVNEFTSVLKYSPFAYTVGIPEMTKQAMTLSATTLKGVEIYLAAGILYFITYRFLLIGIHRVEAYFRVPGIGD